MTFIFNDSSMRDTHGAICFITNILESSTQYSIIGMDTESTILLWNEGAHRIFGYEADEIVGCKKADILYTPEDIASNKPYEILRNAMQLGRWEGPLNRVRKNGEHFVAHVVITSLRDENGAESGYLLISQDISNELKLTKDLKAAQCYTRSLLESNIDALITTDPLGIITDVNQQMCEMTGYSHEQLIGSPFKHYFTDSNLAEDGIRKVLAEDRVSNYELTMLSRDSKQTIVSYNATTLRDADGKLQGVFAAARDISQQKQIEEELREQQFYTRSLIESNIDALMTTNPLGIITDVNQQMCSVTGKSRAELIGTPFKDYFTNPQLAEDGIHKVLINGRVTNYELTIKSSEGKETIVSYNATTFQGADGKLRGVFAAARDITEHKALEEQLQRKNEELEIQYRRVQEANRLKSEFLANMSHELRTPLNGIIGFSDLLHSESIGPVSFEQKEYLGDILMSSKHLLQLINDVLDLAKVEAGKMSFSPEVVDVKKLVAEVRDIVRPLAASKHLQMKTHIDPQLPQIVIDASKFKQVLYNYLSNAIKFTPDEGHVTITILPEEPDRFRVEIQDDGPGIQPENIHQLFVEFQQLDTGTAKKYQGTGLGLALTKRIIEAQGGTVGVQSILGTGSIFIATLPCITTITTEEQFEPSPCERVETMFSPPALHHVLIIEDDLKDQHWLKKTLTSAGFLVDIASTGAEAITQCNQHKYDVITLDLFLPDSGGWDILQRIRNEGLNQDIPIIVITMVGEKALGFGFPINSMLSKPVHLDELWTVLGRIGLIDIPCTVATAEALALSDQRQ